MERNREMGEWEDAGMGRRGRMEVREEGGYGRKEWGGTVLEMSIE